MTIAAQAIVAGADPEQCSSGEDVDVAHAVRAAVSDLAGRFGEFHAADVAWGCHRLAGVIDTMDAALVDRASLLGEFARCLARELDGVAIRALITHFLEHGGEQPDYGHFAVHYGTAEGRAAVLDRFPELRRLLVLLRERVTTHALTVLIDAVTDLPRLRTALGLHGPITGIRTGIGDRHAGGTTVTFVDWAVGSAVHKPRNADQSRFVERLQSALDDDGELFGPLLPRSIDGGESHSWQEVVVHEDLADEADVDTYYRRFGAVTALATMLGATDLHYENIIATRNGPVILDVETITSPSRTESKNAAAAERLSHMLDRGPLHTMLLPMRFLGAGIDLDISGLGTLSVDERSRLTTTRVTGEGTDAIGFETLPASVGVGPNRPTLDSEVVDPRLHVESLILGYTAAKQRIDERRSAVASILSADVPQHIRVVVRPTYIYSRLLDASTHPAYLASDEDRRTLFAKLPVPRSLTNAGPRAAAAVLADEVAALMDLDVPYFAIHSDEPGLFAVNADGVDLTVIDPSPGGRRELTEHLEAFLLRPLVSDIREIRLSLTSSTDDVWSRPSSSSPRASPPVRLLPPEESIVPSADGRSCTWLTVLTLGDGLRLAPIGLGLYEGGGELLAAAALGTDEDRATVAAATRAAHLHDVPSAPDPIHLSPFVGALADHVTLHELAALGGPFGAAAPLPAAPVELLGRVDPEGLDYIGGLGSYLVALSRYPHSAFDADVARRAAHDYLDRHAASVSDWSEPGLAHGTAGRMAALSAVSALLGGDPRIDETLAAAVRTFSDSSRDLQDDLGRTSWCRGYAGILPVVAEVLVSSGDPHRVRDRFEREIELLADVGDESGTDISLCHGIAGRITALLALGRLLGDGDLPARARALRDAAAQRIDTGRWRSGLGRAPELSSFMLGTSGWSLTSAAAGGLVELPAILIGGPRCVG